MSSLSHHSSKGNDLNDEHISISVNRINQPSAENTTRYSGWNEAIGKLKECRKPAKKTKRTEFSIPLLLFNIPLKVDIIVLDTTEVAAETDR